MSRVAKFPLTWPKGVELKVNGSEVTVKGAKAQLSLTLPSGVVLDLNDGGATIASESVEKLPAMSGTTRANINNLIVGVSEGFERKLALVGVGYRAAAQGKSLSLSLGFSHPVDYPVPEGITVETPTPTEIVVKGADKQKVGQVAAEIRAYRPPEPYKGKGVRYVGERVVMKEAKKK
jgi:large subunit ribosomal protein L6